MCETERETEQEREACISQSYIRVPRELAYYGLELVVLCEVRCDKVIGEQAIDFT